ncbi:DNA polymerase III, tau and gamma subunits [Buchnera aphidicola (Nipponaphis monzeni)]|uniref:DNA polymerase III subunit gamma/tau n=1 Tax=Buchnera aphidicola (Nipponaphis monzeni) TaxID=2495405 RepID=A0A455TAM5_9GAMM|nr:DNA polymerase III subunit gamma/tau [Buchnera aphidicola]BBI01364.1 DNA polymerase III, tau and gamma subunits [Buchnera aphidicola (Nipponaphis monzeni)]
MNNTNYNIITKKWRPKSFKEVIGQEYIVKTICNSISLNRIHQAWLLSGIRGVGKTTISRLIAKSLNCEKCISKEPCLLCANCKDIEKGCFLDLIEIDAASKTKIEDIKEILENIQYYPIKGRFKIYLIDEAHMLSNYSFNYLLKLIEEPPQHVKFILSTTNKFKIPNTIISRCLSLNLQPLSQIELYTHLKNVLTVENIFFEQSALHLIASKSEGSVRDALNILEQAISVSYEKITYKKTIQIFGMIDENEIFHLTEALFKKNVKFIFEFLYSKKFTEIDWDNLLLEIMRLMHYMAVLKTFCIFPEKNAYMISYKQLIKKLTDQTCMQIIHSYYNILMIGRKNLSLSPNNKIGVEILLLKILYLT